MPNNNNHHYLLENRKREALSPANLRRLFLKHLEYTLGKDNFSITRNDLFLALAYSVRDLLVERWRDTQQAYYEREAKRVYYLSMEFMIGRSLINSVINLKLIDAWNEVLRELKLDLECMEELEWEAGLGNGGLGRLAACFLDSLATMSIPAYGYGIRYEYGVFSQKIVDGTQIELPDNWLRYGNPWEFCRNEHLHPIKFYGNVVSRRDEEGNDIRFWVDTEDVMALAYDIPVPGYGNEVVNTMRLWSARSTREFDLHFFSEGKYVEAVEKKMLTENISKVLYPADKVIEGKELRIKQEYFLSSASVQDILYRFRKKHADLRLLPNKVAIQLNDTHPSLAIPELMRILTTHERMEWDEAWDITVRTFSYTNHTILPEALETWPVWMIGKILPHHLEIIYRINDIFLTEVMRRFPDDGQRLKRMSIFEEGAEKKVRMAHLCIIGSHAVNGVSRLHTDILKKEVFRDFFEMYPDRFFNVTNGITQRRWLKKANPGLSGLITRHIGDRWILDLSELEKLRPLADDAEFSALWQAVKKENKSRLARHIEEKKCGSVSPDSLFDCQIKRFHEYKRQVLNILHIITLFNRAKDSTSSITVPRTFIFSGKAAPSYMLAKLVIALINAVSRTVENDKTVKDLLRIVFLANYGVTLAERIIPGADLSEQISTAGTEASGTGNMKFALNGALTIGTMDGANIEIMDSIGKENFFLFGLDADGVADLRASGYNPREIYNRLPELKTALDMIAGGFFSPESPEMFRPLVDSLLNQGDPYLVLADYEDYLRSQSEVEKVFLDQSEWTRRSILTTAGMGRFSSDRAIAEYARDIWKATPVSPDRMRKTAQIDNLSCKLPEPFIRQLQEPE
ncbi:MAG: glycogen/starch/alpha-glucan phosphorylase [Geobacteraceae bacterium]|nr:glycogen/starch/alpha-glucan phosphorylase [Geobacteraceae bacterium]